MSETTHGRIVRYLQDAIASEHSFESSLKKFVETASEDDPAFALFHDTAAAVRERFNQLVRRLHSLGGEPSVLGGFFAEVSHAKPAIASKTHDIHEATLSHLTVAYTNARTEQAMLLVLATTASVVGDHTTATLAASLQDGATRDADTLFAAIDPAARTSAGTMPFATAP